MTITQLKIDEHTIYGRHGNAAAYLAVTGVLYFFNGNPIGYVKDSKLWTFLGTHEGWFSDGLLLSLHGCCVGFTRAAPRTQGPGLPVMRPDPKKAQKRALPVIAVRKAAHTRISSQRRWSKTPLAVYLLWLQHQAGE
jgi:hypothetical protein